jgi:hypothetical protein
MVRENLTFVSRNKVENVIFDVMNYIFSIFRYIKKSESDKRLTFDLVLTETSQNLVLPYVTFY